MRRPATKLSPQEHLTSQQFNLEIGILMTINQVLNIDERNVISKQHNFVVQKFWSSRSHFVGETLW
jgi:hypothetical protein